MANTLKLFRNGAVGFIDWLGLLEIVAVGLRQESSTSNSTPNTRQCPLLRKEIARENDFPSHVHSREKNQVMARCKAALQIVDEPETRDVSA